jgi:hypothetical protein
MKDELFAACFFGLLHGKRGAAKGFVVAYLQYRIVH